MSPREYIKKTGSSVFQAMKLFLFILLVFIAVCVWFFTNSPDPYMSQEEKLVNSILGKTAKIIEEKYPLTCVGAGSAMPGRVVKGFRLCFDTKNRLTKDELRHLVIQCTLELLYQININTEIRSALEIYPFTEKDVQIIIYNHDKQGNRSYAPDISNAQLFLGYLKYSSVDPIDTYRYESVTKETYTEALEKVKHVHVTP